MRSLINIPRRSPSPSRATSSRTGMHRSYRCFLVAVGTVILGAYLSASFERAMFVARTHDLPPPRAPPTDEQPVAYLTVAAAVGFIFVASAALLLLFYFVSDLIYVILLIFALGGFQSLTLLISMVLNTLSPQLSKRILLPLVGPVQTTTLISMAPALIIVIVWFIYRQTSWSWTLQDCMGISLLIMIQRVLRLPDIKVSTILLSMAFFYDIFWVFISPYIFTQSVMVTVATGGGTGEAIPMLLRLPRINDELGGYTMLGLGDIALPGLLVSYLLRFDYRDQSNGLFYFPLVTVGYAAGVAVTYVALVLMQSGQPALLYIVPCTLGVVLAVACVRGDVGEMWSGHDEERSRVAAANSRVYGTTNVTLINEDGLGGGNNASRELNGNSGVARSVNSVHPANRQSYDMRQSLLIDNDDGAVQ